MNTRDNGLGIMPKRVLELLACLDEAEIFLARAQDLFDGWWTGVIKVREPHSGDLDEWYVRYASLMKIVEIRMHVEQELLEEVMPFLKDRGCQVDFSKQSTLRSESASGFAEINPEFVFVAPLPEGLN